MKTSSQTEKNKDPVINNRMPTGIPGLDVIINGGFIRNYSYLLVGVAGTGKTIFSLQYLLDGVKLNEKCLYITLAERASEIENNIKNFGWDIKKIHFLDLSPSTDVSATNFQEYQVFSPSEVEQFAVWEKIIDTIKELKPNRVVIDSATQLRYLSQDEFQFRKHILSLVTFLNSHNITSLLLFEPNELDRENSVGLAVNGIIRLKTEISKSNIMYIRSLQVEKFRGSNFLSGLHLLQINKDGIRVFPHFIEKYGQPNPGKKLFPTGIQALDDLLMGGIDSGTTTIISGPSGVGKTTLGTKFLENCARNGNRAVLYTFEESIHSIVSRVSDMKVPVDDLQEKGSLKIIRVNPMTTFPDQFLAMVREYVEQEKVNIVMLDSIRGYTLAMEEFGTLLSHLHNLVTYLNRHEVTTLLINEVENITGDLKVTELGVSHLADNVLLMRYAECEGQVIKLVCCLKKRLSNFQPQLRKISFSSNGIEVGEMLQNMQGVLTGTPIVKAN